METINNRHKFDLEDRTLEFAKRTARLCRALPLDAVNDRPIRQVMGSSGSIGANYREANDALSRKDKIKKMRIALQEANPAFASRMQDLIQESREIKLILSTIVENLKKSKEKDHKF